VQKFSLLLFKIFTVPPFAAATLTLTTSPQQCHYIQMHSLVSEFRTDFTSADPKKHTLLHRTHNALNQTMCSASTLTTTNKAA